MASVFWQETWGSEMAVVTSYSDKYATLNRPVSEILCTDFKQSYLLLRISKPIGTHDSHTSC